MFGGEEVFWLFQLSRKDTEGFKSQGFVEERGGIDEGGVSN